MTNVESPARQDGFCLLVGDVSWRGRWCLLDAESNGLDRQEGGIIALRLACIENHRLENACRWCGKKFRLALTLLCQWESVR